MVTTGAMMLLLLIQQASMILIRTSKALHRLSSCRAFAQGLLLLFLRACLRAQADFEASLLLVTCSGWAYSCV